MLPRNHQSPKPKRLFHLQNLLNQNPSFHPYAFAILFLIFLVNFIRAKISQIGIQNPPTNDPKLFFLCFTMAGLALIALARLSWFLKKINNNLVICLLFIIFGNLLIATGIIIDLNSSIQNYFSIPQEENIAMDALYIIVDGILIALVNGIVNPLWYLKLIIPLSYYIGIIVAASLSEVSFGLTTILFLAFGIAILCLISFLKEYVRLKNFNAKFEDEKVAQIQKVVFESLPQMIAVVNIEGEFIFSNAEFNSTSKKESSPRNFFKKITNIRQENNPEVNQTFNLLLDQTNLLKPNQEELSLVQNYKSHRGSFSLVHNNFKSHRGSFLSTEIHFDDLGKLMEMIIDSFKRGALPSNKQMSFYGKYNEAPKSNLTKSYKIIVNPVVEHQNIIFILNDTTQSDLIATFEDNNNYKERLLASVSHELRTPLNANLTLIETALKQKDIPEVIKKEMLTPAYRSAKLLNYQISDILDFQQIGRSKLHLSYKLRPIRETIEKCCQLLEMQINAKNLTLEVQVDDSVPFLFKTDHERVTQILLNLLSNALKFTFMGKISLRAKMLDAKKLEITVEDTGIGIKHEHQRKIFNEFVSLHEEFNFKNNIKGVGLGLTISENIAKILNNSHKQSISVDSVFKKGSVFSFTIENEGEDLCESPKLLGISTVNSKVSDLPDLKSGSLSSFNEPESPSPLGRKISTGIGLENNSLLSPYFTASKSRLRVSSNPHNNRLINLESSALYNRRSLTFGRGKSTTNLNNKFKILVVDDDPFNIWAMQALFKNLDAEIHSAYNGQEAIDKLIQQESDAKTKYNLIFMDCQMPIMDGCTATKLICEMIKENKIEEVPIIGCTAFSDTANLEACEQAGMKEVVTKPLSSVKITDIWKTYISQNSLILS